MEFLFLFLGARAGESFSLSLNLSFSPQKKKKKHFKTGAPRPSLTLSSRRSSPSSCSRRPTTWTRESEECMVKERKEREKRERKEREREPVKRKKTCLLLFFTLFPRRRRRPSSPAVFFFLFCSRPHLQPHSPFSVRSLRFSLRSSSSPKLSLSDNAGCSDIRGSRREVEARRQ